MKCLFAVNRDVWIKIYAEFLELKDIVQLDKAVVSKQKRNEYLQGICGFALLKMKKKCSILMLADLVKWGKDRKVLFNKLQFDLSNYDLYSECESTVGLQQYMANLCNAELYGTDTGFAALASDITHCPKLTALKICATESIALTSMKGTNFNHAIESTTILFQHCRALEQLYVSGVPLKTRAINDLASNNLRTLIIYNVPQSLQAILENYEKFKHLEKLRMNKVLESFVLESPQSEENTIAAYRTKAQAWKDKGVRFPSLRSVLLPLPHCYLLSVLAPNVQELEFSMTPTGAKEMLGISEIHRDIARNWKQSMRCCIYQDKLCQPNIPWHTLEGCYFVEWHRLQILELRFSTPPALTIVDMNFLAVCASVKTIILEGYLRVTFTALKRIFECNSLKRLVLCEMQCEWAKIDYDNTFKANGLEILELRGVYLPSMVLAVLIDQCDGMLRELHYLPHINQNTNRIFSVVFDVLSRRGKKLTNLIKVSLPWDKGITVWEVLDTLAAVPSLKWMFLKCIGKDQQAQMQGEFARAIALRNMKGKQVNMI